MTDFIKEYADYMGKTKEEVEDYIQHLRTDTYNVLSYSYGKDSGACIYACEQLGIPIHEMITADVWATDDIPADLPPMVEFKDKADKIIKDRYGIDVKHVCAMTTKEKKYNPNFTIPLVSVGGGTNAHTKISCTEECNQNEQNNETGNTNNTTSATDHKDKNTSTDSLADRNLGAIRISKSMCLKNCKLTYQDLFYRTSNGKIARGGTEDFQRRSRITVQANSNKAIYGFPIRNCQYCTGELKKGALQRISNINQPRKLVHITQNKVFSQSTTKQGADINIVSLMGIAYDEPIRIKKHINKPNVFLPLVATGMWEKDCYKWCEENDLLSPIYSGATRGGCWFCHNQGVDQLRKLRKEYPNLWELLLKWDNDSPVTFHADGHTVHDFDRRFKAEDEGFNKCGERFRWNSLENQQYNIFHYFNEDGTFKENNLMESRNEIQSNDSLV